MEAKQQRLQHLDGLRAIAALAVVFFHLLFRESNTSPLVLGAYGVHLFFIISGFVILISLKHSSTLSFLIKRAIRLYPLYALCVLLTSTILFLLKSDEFLGWSVTAKNFLFFHRFLGVPHVDPVYWTLLLEVIFYLQIAFLVGVGRRWFSLEKLIWFFVTAGAGFNMLWLLAERFLEIQTPQVLSILTLHDFGVFFRIGALFYLMRFAEGIEKKALILSAILIAAELVLSSLAVPYGQFYRDPLFNLGGGLVAVAIAALAIFWQPLQKLLSIRLLVLLGAASYALYLLHSHIGIALRIELWKHDVNASLATGLVILFGVLLSLIVTRFYDVPVRSLLLKSVRRFTT